MHFSAEHRFAAPPEAVAAVLSDPDFYRSLELPDLRLLDVRAAEPTGAQPSGPPGVLLRYEFVGGLDPMALRLLGGTRLTWTQEVRLDGAAGGTLSFAAESKPEVLHGEATFVLVALGEGSVRRLEGELVVAVPVVGGMAERRIVPGVLSRLDVEAAAARGRLAAG